jgi:hypothetical protein
MLKMFRILSGLCHGDPGAITTPFGQMRISHAKCDVFHLEGAAALTVCSRP